MRMEGEDDLALGELAPALLDDADAAVAVPEGERERAAQRADRVVDRHRRIELAPIRQHLGATADPGERRVHPDLAVLDRARRFRPHFH